MANIPVAPFYVPRPAEEQLWSKSFVPSPVLRFLTQQKMFGQGGQVPAKRWNSFYTDNDASVWNWPPQPSDTISLLTFQKFFNAGGQVPAKRWNITYTFDDPAVWPGNSIHSSIIQILTNRKFFGQGGQVPTKRWNISYTFDDPAVWNSKPIATNTPYPAATIVRAPFYAPSSDHTIGWAKSPATKFSGLNLIVSNPFIPTFWDFNNDDPSPWQQPVQRSIALPFVPKINSISWRWGIDDTAVSWQQPVQRSVALPFVPSIQNRWRLDLSDDQPWSLTIQRDTPLNTVTVTVSPFINRQSSFYTDDQPLWQGSPILSKLLLPLLTAAKPIKSQQWIFGYDDPAYWVGKSINVASPIPMLTIGGIIKARQWHWDNDDSAMWSGWTNRNLTNITTAFVPPNPLVPVFYRFHMDDAAIWQQPKQRSITLPFVPSIVDHWRMDISDDQPWSLSIRYNLAGAAKPAPFISQRYQFAVDDPSIWQQSAQRSIGLFVPSIQNRWRLDTADDQLWSYSLNRNAIGLVMPIGKVTNLNFNVDDNAVWQPIKLRGITLQMVPAINNRWQPNTFDDLPWSPTKRLDLPMLVFVFVPPTFTSRQPTFAFDDQSSYQWPMKSSLILSLKWNINFERIGNTTTERRIVMASLERHIVTATPEIRIVGTKIETRIATTTPETRIANTIDEDKIP